MAGHYTISEFQGFTIAGNPPIAGYQPLEPALFLRLKDLVLTQRPRGGTDGLPFLSLSARHGAGEVLTARSYVGMIEMRDGTDIEILPKIYGTDEAAARALLIRMLQTVRDVPFQTFGTAHFDTAPMRIFEIFIDMFIREVSRLVKGGLRSGYRSRQGNETFFKGKLLVSQHIRRNFAHQEHAYLEYGVFTVDRPENRLLKTTLQFLYRQTTDAQNKRRLHALLSAFSGVPESNYFEQDFARCTGGRLMSSYSTALKWCHIFLSGRSFGAFRGREVSCALLFPMEQLFERYVAAQFRRCAPPDYEITVQAHGLYLFDSPQKQFSLRPDLVVRDRRSGAIAVLDTKWKRLSAAAPNCGISQADMYQMYAYGKKYSAAKVLTLYPLCESASGITAPLRYESPGDPPVEVHLIDLVHIEASIAALLTSLPTGESTGAP